MSTLKKLQIPAQELADFMNTGWPKPEDSWYYDDKDDDLWEKTFKEDPKNPSLYVAIDPTALINLHEFEASILFQGPGEDPTHGEGYSLVSTFMKWQAQQTSLKLVVEIPKDKLKELTAFLAAIKGKVTEN
jgi:hypothetical protein